MAEKDFSLAYRRSVAVAVAFAILYFSYWVIKPFLAAVVGAAVLAYLCYPLYHLINKHLPDRPISQVAAALLTESLVLLLVILPTILLATLLAEEAQSWFLYLQNALATPSFSLDLPPAVTSRLASFPQLKEVLLNLAGQLALWTQGMLRKVPGAFLGILILLFSFYYFLKEGTTISQTLQNIFPLPKKSYQQIVKRFESLSRGLILGQLIVGVIHGLIAWGVFSLLGINNPALWSFMTAIVSIIPVVGTSLVWLPMALIRYAAGYNGQGLALLIYGLAASNLVDNVLRPKIISDQAKIHPLVILLGILGGVQMIGLPGLLIGPLLLALFDVVVSLLKNEVN